MTTPRHKLANHENPMVRAHGLAGEGVTCSGCLFRKPGPRSWRRHSLCSFRSSRRHLACWDACSLYRKRSRS